MPEAKFLKWLAVVAIALLAALFAWYDHTRNSKLLSLNDEIRKKEEEQADSISQMRRLLADMREAGIAAQLLRDAIGQWDEDRAFTRLLLTLESIEFPVDDADQVNVGAGPVALADVADRRIGKMTKENSRLADDLKADKPLLSVLRAEKDRLEVARRRTFATLQLLTVAAVVVSAFPVGRD